MTGKEKKKKGLRWGFSTGTAASAAAKAAVSCLMGKKVTNKVAVTLPGGRTIMIPIETISKNSGSCQCTVIKDGGDDPDVTHGAQIGVRARIISVIDRQHPILIKGGEGVGTVTKPGLPIPPGQPAINPVPRRMIYQAVKEAGATLANRENLSFEIEVFVPKGEELARETLNPRLGIKGGISILGTTGLVKPFSHGAYRATIYAALKVAKGSNLREIIFTTGTTSDRIAQALFPDLPEEAFVQMADYVAFSIRQASKMGFKGIKVVCFIGKALKMAQGLHHTHASSGEIDLNLLAKWTLEVTGDRYLAKEITKANTARGALELLKGANALDVVARVGSGMKKALNKYIVEPCHIEVTILDFSGTVLWKSLDM